mgnify:CR=1 FL=1
MKNKLLFVTVIAILFSVSLPGVTRAQMMGSAVSSAVTAQTVQDEAAGKAILDKLQSNQTSCSSLSDADFDKLGDYYMGRMMGTSHSAMDVLMTQRIGENNNQLMHIALGKRLSGCDTSAVFPTQGAGFLPMMGMMGGWSASYDGYQPNYINSMMGNYFGYPSGYSMMGYGGFSSGWVGILWWVLIIIGTVLFVRWAIGQSRGHAGHRGETALDVLKGRYAKGEIDKKEFEEKKKDLND